MNILSETWPNENIDLYPDNMKWRVKLYYLNSHGEWDEITTGYVYISNKVC